MNRSSKKLRLSLNKETLRSLDAAALQNAAGAATTYCMGTATCLNSNMVAKCSISGCAANCFSKTACPDCPTATEGPG